MICARTKEYFFLFMFCMVAALPQSVQAVRTQRCIVAGARCVLAYCIYASARSCADVADGFAYITQQYKHSVGWSLTNDQHNQEVAALSKELANNERLYRLYAYTGYIFAGANVVSAMRFVGTF